MSRAGAKADRSTDDLYVTPRAAVAPLLEELARYLPERPYVLDPGAGSGSISQAVLEQWPRAYVDACELRDVHADALGAVQGAEVTSEANGHPYRAQIMRIHWGDFLTTTPDWEWRRLDWADHSGPTPPDLGGPSLVVANPPYGHAEAFIRRSLEVVDAGFVAMLLRVSFLESQERYPFWTDHPISALRILVQRPSFSIPEYIEGVQQPDFFGDVHEVSLPVGGSDMSAYAWFVWDTWGRRAAPLPPFGWYNWRVAA